MNKRIGQIRNFYRDQSSDNCLKLLTGSGKKQIVLIRHARPNVTPPPQVNFEEAENYLNAYRKAGIIPFDDHPVCTENLPPMHIYCSSLERARQTARHIFPEPRFTIIEDYRFRELDRENIRLPFRVSHKMHTRLSRLAWLTGLQKADENYRTAMQRIKDSADHLDQLSGQQNLIILVAHGFQNFFLARKLGNLGWVKVFDSGNEHLSVKILAK